jgi:ATP-dependent RNA helicase DDX5/DBP2
VSTKPFSPLGLCLFSRQQAERDWVLAEFKAGRSPIMLATDVASRGLGMFPSISQRGLGVLNGPIGEHP